MTSLQRWLQRAVPATPQERAAAFWSFAYFFALLAGYYVLRPLRDQMGIAGGTRGLPWLFTATFVSLIVMQPLYGWLVAKLPRTKFIPVVYHFFVANLLLFWLLLTFGVAEVIVARVFFVWVSVFNLFAVAVFWSFMADLFTAEQGKRLFGFIGAGGTAGALLGPVITIALAQPLGAINLLIVAAVFLEIAVFCVFRLERASREQRSLDQTIDGASTQPALDTRRIGGGAFAAMITGPWVVGQLDTAAGKAGWTASHVATAPLPAGPSGNVSFSAGGTWGVLANSGNSDAAWKLVRYVSKPSTQVAQYKAYSSLPAVVSAWDDSAIAGQPLLDAFLSQLKNTRAFPQVASWQQVGTRLGQEMEAVAKGKESAATAAANVQAYAKSLGTGAA